MISIENGILLDEREIEESFIRASGPGGQNVNKVASAVQLRFDVRNSPSLPQPLRERLERLGGSRVTQDGVLVITAHRFRSQERNRQDALDRLVELLRRADDPAQAPPARAAAKAAAGDEADRSGARTPPRRQGAAQPGQAPSGWRGGSVIRVPAV